MERFSDDDLRELLEALHDKYNRPEFIPDDPISVPYRYTGRADREIAASFPPRSPGAIARRLSAAATA